MESTVMVSATPRNGLETVPMSPVMTLVEAAAYLNATVGWVRQQLYSGALSYQKIGKRHVVKRAEVEGLLNRGWKRNGTS